MTGPDTQLWKTSLQEWQRERSDSKGKQLGDDGLSPGQRESRHEEPARKGLASQCDGGKGMKKSICVLGGQW